MGFLGGTKSKLPESSIEKYLLADEMITDIYKFKRDLVSLTDKRIIYIDKSLLSRRKVVRTIPYKKINSIALIKSHKIFTFTDEIQISTRNDEYSFKISKAENIRELYNTLSERICN